MTEHMHEELRDSAGDESADESGIDVVLVTGLSGAGRGTAAKVLRTSAGMARTTCRQSG
jgi:UPF0042 nucleotide-binding protein